MLEGSQFVSNAAHCRMVNFRVFWRRPYNPSQSDDSFVYTYLSAPEHQTAKSPAFIVVVMLHVHVVANYNIIVEVRQVHLFFFSNLVSERRFTFWGEWPHFEIEIC